MHSRLKMTRYFFCLLMAVVLLPGAAQSAQTATSLQKADTQKPSDIPVMDGEAGPCSVEFTVVDKDGKPVNAALISVKMAYGFAGIRKVEMGVYTNAQGKGKFIGIAAKVHKPPLEFLASAGNTPNQLTGIGRVDPATECQAKHDIVLEKKSSQ